MKVFCNSADFADAINKVAKALPVKKTQPILESIKISAYGDEMTFVATDDNLAIIKKIKADVQMEGEVLVPSKIPTELAKKISYENTIELSDVNDDNLTLNYGDGSAFLVLMNILEYPIISEDEYENKITMLQKDFKDMINKTIFATSSDGGREIYKGCLLEIEGSIARLVALDGYRLAICSKELPMQYPDNSIIIPAKSLQEIAKLLDDDEEIVNIEFSDKSVMVDIGHTKIKSKLLSGNFIKYRDTFPKSFEAYVTVDRKVLEEAIDRASIISRFNKYNNLKLEIKEGVMYINSVSELGESKEKVNVFTKGKDIKIGFNAKYLSDCLKYVNNEFVLFKLSSPTSAAVFTPVEGDDFIYIIVPIR
ncbi:MAG: DNA polymerase III subunit beta [Christensenellales bacterium]